jgi:hypothetical protein
MTLDPAASRTPPDLFALGNPRSRGEVGVDDPRADRCAKSVSGSAAGARVRATLVSEYHVMHTRA